MQTPPDPNAPTARATDPLSSGANESAARGAPAAREIAAPGEDGALVKRALDGDADASRIFLERMRCVSRMLAARNRRLSSPLDDDELEDLAQETVVEIWNHMRDYDGQTSLEGWCWGFCRYALLRRLRSARRRGDMLARAEAELAARDRSSGEPDIEDHEPLRAELARLDPEESAVVQLKHFHELTFDEIAGRLSIPANTAKTRYYRALSRLRERLARTDARPTPPTERR